MGTTNIVIPDGILSTWQGPQQREHGNISGNNEAFDITEVARQRARSLSVSLEGQGRSRAQNLGRLASIVQSNQNSSGVLQQRPYDFRRRDARTQQRQRPNSINLAGLARSRATGLSSPANPGLALDRTSSISFAIKSGSAQRPANSTIRHELENSYIFQSLNNYQLSGQDAGQASSVPAVFLARNGSKRTAALRTESSQKPLERSYSDSSQFSAIDVVRRASIAVENAVEKVKETVNSALRRSSLQEIYEKAKIREVQLKRSTAVQYGFEYFFYLLMLATIYFVFIGYPLWNGLVLTIYYLFDTKLVVPAGTAIFLGIGFLYAYLPLLISFEKEPPGWPARDSLDQSEKGHTNDTALLIPCYKSEKLIGATLEAALKVFPAQNIFVIANGNSPTPLDNTAAVCERYGVSHTWSPIGSKIVAQFVGCYVCKQFPYVLLIDDDCLLPPNFPIVTDRIHGKTLCIGYTIKSVGPNSSKGTLCQQAQDVEYKISGIQRAFAGKIGSATFPHGAISIWDRELLIKTFQNHPGFSVSEDWFFGHVARQLGCRIKMCTAVFVETETPTSIFYSSGGARGGFGEMTIYKQRFFRWNYFFVSGLFWDMNYIIRNWKLGWWEFGAKLFVFQEVYETLLYLLAPFVLPISFYVRPQFSGYLYVATLALYQINVVIFNYVHLRSRHESVSALCLAYYLYYKVILTFVNIASCYYSIYKYAKYFAKRHPKVVEDEKAVAVVLRLEEETNSKMERTRRFTVTAVGTNLTSVAQEPQSEGPPAQVDVVDFAAQLEPVPEHGTPNKARRLPSLSRIGRMPPPIPPARRPLSGQRTTSNASSGSNVSPLDERKKPLFSNPPPRRLFPEQRTTSNESSGSNVSPFDESRNPYFPLPPSDTALPIELQYGGRAPIRQPSPSLFHRSTHMNPLALSPPDEENPLVRRPSGAPAPRPKPISPSQRSSSRTFSQLLRRQSTSSRDSTLTFHIPTPTIEYPPPATLSHQRRQYILLDETRGVWPMPRGWPLPEPYPEGYISALANSSDQPAPDLIRDRVFIEEDEEEEEEMEMGRDGGGGCGGKSSRQTDWRSRVSIQVEDDNYF